MKKYLLFLPILFLLNSCNESNTEEDLTKTIDKKNSIEVEFKTIPTKQNTLLYLNYFVWVNNKKIESLKLIDTLPLLGKEIIPQEENETIKYIPVQKNYEIYVTIK